jgi:hypothetical protein
MLARQQGLMQDAGDQNASELLTIEHAMLAMPHPPQAGANLIPRPAQRRIAGQGLAKNFEAGSIAGSLGCSPGTKRVIGDAGQVGFCAARKAKYSHGERPELTRFPGKLESLTNAPEDAGLGNTAGVTFVNGSAECGKLRFILPFFTFPSS